MGTVRMTVIAALDLPEDWDELEDSDLATAFVIAEPVRIVRKDHASMSRLESGAIEIRLLTGEIFHLDEATVTRVA